MYRGQTIIEHIEIDTHTKVTYKGQLRTHIGRDRVRSTEGSRSKKIKTNTLQI